MRLSFLAGLAAVASLALAFTAAPDVAAAKNVASADCYVMYDGQNCQEVTENYGQPVVRGGRPNSLSVSSGNVANASAAATIAAVAAKLNYINGFSCTAGGATAAAVVNVTVTGLLGGTLTYSFATPAGATAGSTPLVINFPDALPASAVNTAIVVTMPALGAGNTNAACNIHGFRLG